MGNGKSGFRLDWDYIFIGGLVAVLFALVIFTVDLSDSTSDSGKKHSDDGISTMANGKPGLEIAPGIGIDTDGNPGVSF